MKDGIVRRSLVGIWRFFKRIQYKRRRVYLDTNVAFNYSTRFGEYCRVHKGSNVTDSIIGSYTYISTNCDLPNCEIGKFCSLASNITIISSTHPCRSFVSTSPVFYSLQNQCGTTFVRESKFKEIINEGCHTIIIGNDVWIGQNVTLMGGIRIGDGAIIGTGSVVTKDVPPYAIVGGLPAKVIRYRFSNEQISILLTDKWWEKSIDWIMQHAKEFCSIDFYFQLINDKS